jgi:hypothetical protein
MYLKRLYQHNKYWFLVIALFITGQVFINYKRGVVFSPFFHYGMYSDLIQPANEYKVIEVLVNEKQLSTSNFSPQEWDRITVPAERFYSQEKWNGKLFKQDIHRMLPFTDSLRFTNTITEEQFSNWYQQQLEDITGQKINTYKIIFTDYTFSETGFKKTTP